MHVVENEKENINADLLEMFTYKTSGLRHASFQSSVEEGIKNAMRMTYKREKQFWFELLKGVQLEDEVEHEGETGNMKQVL